MRSWCVLHCPLYFSVLTLVCLVSSCWRSGERALCAVVSLSLSLSLPRPTRFLAGWFICRLIPRTCVFPQRRCEQKIKQQSEDKHTWISVYELNDPEVLIWSGSSNSERKLKLINWCLVLSFCVKLHDNQSEKFPSKPNLWPRRPTLMSHGPVRSGLLHTAWRCDLTEFDHTE